MDQKSGMEFLETLDPAGPRNLNKIRARCPELVDALVQRLYGEIYQRGKLTLRERFLVSIAVTMASGNMHSQLVYQSKLALRHGLTREELMEIALQISVFSGLATAINSMLILDEVTEKPLLRREPSPTI